METKETWNTVARKNRMPSCLFSIATNEIAEALGKNGGLLWQMSVEEFDNQILQPAFDDALKSCFQEMITDILDIRYYLGLEKELQFYE